MIEIELDLTVSERNVGEYLCLITIQFNEGAIRRSFSHQTIAASENDPW